MDQLGLALEASLGLAVSCHRSGNESGDQDAGAHNDTSAEHVSLPVWPGHIFGCTLLASPDADGPNHGMRHNALRVLTTAYSHSITEPSSGTHHRDLVA